jgi:ribosomal protein L33
MQKYCPRCECKTEWDEIKGIVKDRVVLQCNECGYTEEPGDDEGYA